MVAQYVIYPKALILKIVLLIKINYLKLFKIISYLTWGGNVPKNNLVAFLKKATKLSILVLPRPQIPN